MANKRNKKKLYSKQVISDISAVFITYVLILGMSRDSTVAGEVYFWIAVLGAVVIYIAFCSFISKEEERKIAKEEERERENVIMRQILQQEGYKPYTKLTEDNNIYLIVKNKQNKVVYSGEIENHG